jgi:O-6-methylguanine DNA methyltransferase
MRSFSISRSRFWSSSRSGEPGAYDLTGSFSGAGGLKNPGALIGSIVKSGEVRATFTQYEVPGWGVGELWTDDELVLAHEFRFQTAPGVSAKGADAAHAAPAGPPKGAHAPLSSTVPRDFERMENAFMPDVQHASAAAVSASESISEAASGASVATSARKSEATAGSRRRPPDLQASVRRFEDDLVGRFRAFLAGEEVELGDVRIDLDWATPFQRAVTTALRAVPRGEVVSYGEVAALAGYPGAARAAGTFCARNRFMLVVPCHRVVGAHGPGGYGSAGVETKRRLLALEGVRV